MRPSRFPGLLPLLILGCASHTPDPNPDQGKGGTTCTHGPGYGEPAEPQVVESLSATLVDLDGEPMANELVQLCGLDICIPGKSTADGLVAISSQDPITKPAFKFGEGKQSPRFAVLLPPEAKVELGTFRTVRLPAIETGAALVAGEEASSGGVHVLPPAGSKITIDKLTFSDPAEQRFRAVRVPFERAPELVDASFGFDLVYAATPTDTVFCPPAKLGIDNDEGYAAGTRFEVFLHGVDIEQEWAPYGGWAKVSEAEVSADGARIETTTPGLPMLGVLGLRRR